MSEYVSDCGKSFKTLSELTRHRKNCKVCLLSNADRQKAAKKPVEVERKKIVWRSG